jgi:hypothetical protein
MRREYLPARIALVANGISMIVLYPLNMLVFERPSWVWDYPEANLAMEHMLVAICVTRRVLFAGGNGEPHFCEIFVPPDHNPPEIDARLPRAAVLANVGFASPRYPE